LLLQAIAARVGVVTGCHLAELCRMEYSPVVRTVLWLMAEVAIVGADIQEGAVPLWAGVLITGLDSFLLLFLENLGIRKLEALFGLFISIMAVSFARMFLEAAPDTGAIAQGLLIPSIPRGAMGMAVSIVGAVIMPHNIFLHSALVQSRAIDRHSPARVSEALVYFTLESAIALLLSFLVNLCVVSVFAKLFYGRPGAVDIGLDNAAEYLQEAFGSSTFPVVFIWAAGLLAAGQSSTMTGTYAGQFVMSGFLDLHVCKWEAFGSSTFPVVFIWAAGLLAAGQSSTMTGTYAGQFVMSGFLDLHVCKWEAFGSSTFPVVFIWAAGLLAAGQSSTMTGTYAGQFVMSGFLDLHVRKWVRVLVTRTVAIVPTIVVALLYSSPAASPPVAALFVPLTGAADTSAAAAAVPTFVNVSTPFRPATATAAASLLFSSPLAALPSPITDHSLVSSISPSNASLQFITSLAASLPFSSTPHSSSYPLSSPPSTLPAALTPHASLTPPMLTISSLDSLNEWLNVLQSVQLPFAIIPLLAIATSPHVMGRYAIKGAVKVLAWASAALVIAINLYLLLDFSRTNLPHSLTTLCLLLLLALPYLLFLLHLALRPRSEGAEFSHHHRHSSGAHPGAHLHGSYSNEHSSNSLAPQPGHSGRQTGLGAPLLEG
ncbi:hypothetical protein CLOP_g17322, partial [Closterium sp. NIES-67]